MMVSRNNLNANYFSDKMKRLLDSLPRCSRDEFARECLRMARVADEAVVLEAEFVGDLPREAARYRYLRDTAQMRFKPAGSGTAVQTAAETDAAIDAEIAKAVDKGATA